MPRLTPSEASAFRARAKSIILRWVDKLQAPASARAIMSDSIDRMFVELPRRDASFEIMTVSLDQTENLPIALRGDTWRAFPCASQLAITTIVPNWAQGWRQIFSDEAAYHHLTWFLHYARQYVHRSHVAKILMVGWDRGEHVLHPFGSQYISRTFHLPSSARSIRHLLDDAESAAKAEWGEPSRQRDVRSKWSAANTLDPNIHQAIFHFTRGHSLLQSGFELEAVVAFDCALQAIKTLFVQGGLLGNGASRTDLCAALGLGKHMAASAAEAHFLRNKVGAHAGGWRWWDTGELTERLVPEMSRTVRRALGKAVAIEPQVRHVDPTPESWSDWLLVNFEMLWEIVWFEKIHTI